MDDKLNLEKATIEIKETLASKGKLSHLETGNIYLKHKCYDAAVNNFCQGHCEDKDSNCSAVLACVLMERDIQRSDALNRLEFSMSMNFMMKNMAANKSTHTRYGLEEMLLIEAAERGNLNAMFMIAYYQAMGKCGNITEEEADKWLKLAADKGLPEAKEVWKELHGNMFSKVCGVVKRAVLNVASEQVEDGLCDELDDYLAPKK